MAVFNPETSVNLGDNYTTRSQGQTPNKALGYLFGGIADAISAVTKGQKEKQDNAIANAAQQGVDVLAGGEGDITLSSPDRIFSPPRRVGGAGSGPDNFEALEIAPAMTAAETKLTRLKAARDQGSLPSDLYFSQQVAVLTKRLNSQFPGEEAKVAAMVERALGTSSANRVRKEQLALLNAEGSAADSEDKRKKQILKEAANDGYISDPYIMTTYEQYAGRAFNPEDFNDTALLAAISKRKYKDSEIDRYLKEAQVKTVGSKDREDMFKKGVTEQVLTLADRLLYTNLNTKQDIRGLEEPQTSIDFRNVRSMIAEQLSGGKPITPDQMVAIRNQLNQLDVQLSSAFDQLLNTYATEIPNAKDREDIKAMGMAPLQIMKNSFGGPNPDLGIIGAAKAAVEAQDNAFVLSNGRFDKNLDMAIKMLGKESVNKLLMMGLTGEVMLPEEEAVFNTLKLYLAGGKSLTDLLKNARKDGTLTQQEVSKLVSPAIQQYVETILTSEDPKAVQKAAQSLYNEDERKVIETHSKTNPDATFRLLVSPEMTEKLKGTPEFKNYSNFAKFQARPLFKQWADTAADVQAHTGSGVITWDEGSHRFTYQLDRSKLPSGYGFGPAAFRDWDLYQADKGRVAVESINQYLDRMDGIFKIDGDTPEGFLQGFFGSQSFKDMKKQGSLLDRMNSGLNKWLDEKMATEEEIKKGSPGIENFDTDLMNRDILGTSPQGSNTKQMLEDTMSAPNLISEFEGFRDKPYWDVNAWRVGFGSDTYTDEKGNIKRVTRNTKITKEQALIDLFNRVGGFEADLAEDIGPNAWNSLNAKQRAALTSVAYNYGSIPKVLATAVQSGDKGKIQAAFANLSAHNAGINKKRRMKELRVFLGAE